MADLGAMALLLGLALSAYSVIGSAIGVKIGMPALIVSARRALYMTTLAAAVASAALINAFVQNDFSIKYVADHSNSVMERAFVWVAFYSGNEGSLLYIVLALGVMSALAIRFAPKRMAPSMPWTIAVLAAVQLFYFFVLSFFASPFELLETIPVDGRGINPLLTHPGMFSHPPMLMGGLIAITIPFAFASGALISGNYGDDWVDVARVSAILSWGVLGAGLLLGAWWAYTILGWGGYWAWDPIENVALMPWLVLTAFIHSIMVQKRRGMFRMWNVALLNIAFVLAQLGMFINRGGPVVSVHSFASSTLGVIFLSFMLLSLVFAFGLFLWRMPQLKSERAMESFMSREASFLVNNFLLLSVVAVTLWGVVFPLFSDLARDVSVSVSAPYFNRANGPILLGIVLMMGVGPLLPWRKSSARSLKKWFIWPVAIGVLTIVVLVAFGVKRPVAIFSFGVVAFVATSIMQEWWRGTAARHRGGENWALAWWRLVNGNRPRHGGYIVHLSILMLGLGIIGTNFYQQRTDGALALGESLVIDNYRIEYVDNGNSNRPDRIAQWADMSIYRIDTADYAAEISFARAQGSDGFTLKDSTPRPNDRLIGQIQPWHGFYPDFNMASVRSGIRSTIVEDLYVIPRDFLSDGRVSLAVSINPLAWWLWASGPFFILGTMVALWPQPAVERRPARSKVRTMAVGEV
ncbi:MAG: cytochrome c biogenesis protein CcsA [Chloroflexi bacterium]|nr:cytochrome c biogenesis protein CcsA [Chloroflexota bacterium]MCI0803123.1 cytochrome c biogenesis protein CcsA [Chloroflexota bacterium]MCI0833407.1 cytochrome c biogenesis protein CcsA [Chloroflexota bacterium]